MTTMSDQFLRYRTEAEKNRMSESMVERVAKAIWEADPYADEKSAWDDLPAHCKRLGEPDVQEQMRNLARAAIAAMRDPTEAQQAAFAKTLDWMADTPLGHQQRRAWREENIRRWHLMIDAALSDPPATAEGEARS